MYIVKICQQQSPSQGKLIYICTTTNASCCPYLKHYPDQAYPDEESVEVGEDVPLHGQDGGEEGEQEEGGQEGQGDGQEGGDEAGDQCDQLHL